jgi:hypothetical protein
LDSKCFFKLTCSTTALKVESNGKRIENELISTELARFSSISSVRIVFWSSIRSLVNFSDWIKRIKEISYQTNKYLYRFKTKFEIEKLTCTIKIHCCWQSITNCEHFNFICVSIPRINWEENWWSSIWILRIQWEKKTMLLILIKVILLNRPVHLGDHLVIDKRNFLYTCNHLITENIHEHMYWIQIR